VRLFCDMDGVLVRQTGRDGFDSMPWMPDGKVLWQFIAPFRPTILSMLPREKMTRCEPEKQAWCLRELGPDVAVIVTPDNLGKGPHSSPGAILIDDGLMRHQPDWLKGGGIFLHHVSAEKTIERLKQILQVLKR
jgi:hypothetical protein